MTNQYNKGKSIIFESDKISEKMQMTDKIQNFQTHKRYEELDALRGIAALIVVFFHFTMGQKEFNTFFKLGTTGVDLFFYY